MNKKTILEISLYAQYYKKDITDKYMINNKSLIITNEAIDILDKPQEKLYIEPWTKKIEKDKEIERLNNIINNVKEIIDNYFSYDYENESMARLDTINKINHIIVELKEGEKNVEN